MDHLTLTTPLLGVVDIPWLELATDNLCTKCEVSSSTSYKDMKGDRKCTKWGGLGSLGSLKVISNVAMR